MGRVFVLDASVRRQLRDGEARLPPIWEMDVANVLVQAERRERLSPAETVRFLDLLSALPIEIQSEPDGRVLREIRAQARDRGLSVYDACYLDLAMREALPLATVDFALKRAAGETGVEVLAPE